MENNVNAILSLLGLGVIAWLSFSAYPKYQADRFRQEIFNLRDALFVDAADGKISFEHPAYLLLRSTMNGYLRFASNLSLIEVLYLGWKLRNDKIKNPYEVEFLSAISDLSDEMKLKLTEYKKSMHSQIIIRISYGTVFSVVCIGLFVAAIKSYLRIQRMRKHSSLIIADFPRMKERIERLDYAASGFQKTAGKVPTHTKTMRHAIH